MRMAVRVVVSLGFSLCGSLLAAQQAAAPGNFLESKAIPVLRKNCFPCHNDQTRSSGLSITSRGSLIAGGNRGAAIVPGRDWESLLIQVVQQKGSLKMPPGGAKLPDDDIAMLAEWVNRNAPWTEPANKPTTISTSPAAKHWSFQPVKRPTVPAVRSGRVHNPIDNFILARLEKERIAPSQEAARPILIRRLSLDLIGLPPTWDEVEQFVLDPRPDAYERLVDRLLASPHYGERWGRHWLDVARYADTNGYTRDNFRQIWMYRDWVIQALNRDLPFNEFIVEQFAGDLLPQAGRDQIVATGFHRNTQLNLEGGVDFEQYRVEAVVDRISTTGRALLGLTLGCARCHDHKYDPVSQREFYQLYAFFNSIDELSGEFSEKEARARVFEPTLEFGTLEQYARREAVRRQIAALQAELAGYEKGIDERFADWERTFSAEQRAGLSRETAQALRTPPGERTETQRKILRELSRRLDAGFQQRTAGIKALEQKEPKIPHTLVMRELPRPRPTRILIGGDFTSKGMEVQPGTPAFLPPIEKHGPAATRLDFARWLVDPRNPLTARVTTNRIWQHYFGRGIVPTEDDFGLRGARPTHPELLDWLTSEFVERGWGMKALHRLIVTSATYRQSSVLRDDLRNADPENYLLARQTRLRLESEIIRDAGLRVSGLLQSKIGGPSVFPPQPEIGGPVPESGPWVTDKGESRYRRGLYTSMRRGSPHPVSMAFDQPDAGQSCTRRGRSTTPLQALALLNDEAFHEFAQGVARRILEPPSTDSHGRLELAFKLCLGRPPESGERESFERFLARELDRFQTHPDEARLILGNNGDRDQAVTAAWTAVGRVLLNLDEFFTRE